MQVGLRSIRVGRGTKENNTAEKMVMSFKNDSYNVTRIKEGKDNLQLYMGFHLLHVEGSV